MENNVLVVAVRKHLGNPITLTTRKVFKTTADAYEYIKSLDKDYYSKVRIYEEKEVIDF